MAKLKGVKFVQEVVAPNKAALEAALPELMDKMDAKFPMTISSGKGKEKVSVTISMIQG